MSDRWPVEIRDDDGEFIQVDIAPSGRIWLGTSAPGVLLNAAQRNELEQAYAAACHEAEGRVSRG